MEQMALYREWRPQTFRDVVGQEHVCRTLQNAVLMERIAHAYLFCGPRGTGKTSTARILAKALNCPSLKDGEPCGVCSSCQGITNGISLNVIEMDAASHRGIEEIRDLKQKVGMAPSGGRYKVYIIDEVHMLTGEAFNALLKTLEEPPAHAVFILATTEAHKVPLTVLSRCQRFDFRRLSCSVIKNHLAKVARAKGWSVEDGALELISRQASGALRDALGLLDQAASFTGGEIRRQDIELLTGALGVDELEGVTAAAAQGDVPGVLQQMDAIFARGSDPRQVLLQLADYVRDMIFRQGAGREEQMFYARFLREIAFVEGEMKGSPRPDLLLELALLRLTGTSSASEENHLQKRSSQAVREQAASAHPSTTRYAVQGNPRQEAAAPRKTKEENVKGESYPGKRDLPLQQEVKAYPKIEETPHPEKKDLQQRQKVDGSGKTRKETSFSADNLLPTANQNFDLAAIHKFLIKAAGKQPILSSVLPKCKLKRQGDSLLLMAPSLYCELIKRDENLKVLKDGLREYGCSLQLEVALEDTPPSSASVTPEFQRQSRLDNQGDDNPVPGSPSEMEANPEQDSTEMPGQPQDQDLINIVLNLFDGKIIKRIKEGE
ncbi:MAG: DNA polymerase III subunit gamma/tau [Syntrophaceticus sp.]